MAEGKRTYEDSCGIARALNVIGERWTLLVVRELILGAKRFTDLRTGLPGVSADVLSQRLRELEAAGLLARRTLPPPAAVRVYELTERGRDLEPALQALGRWGSRVTLPADPAPLSDDATVVALQTMFDPAAAGSLDAAYELRLGRRPFALQTGGGRLHARQGAAEGATATISTDSGTLVSVLWHGQALAEAVAAGSLTIDGDRAAAEQLLGSFSAHA